MPAITLKGKAGPPTTRKDGSTIVVSKAVTAVLEERFPRTAMKGKQAASVSAIELHTALKKERQTTQTLVSKHANETFDEAAKKAEATLKKAKKDTAIAMSEAANKMLDLQEKKTAAAMKAVIDKAAAATAKAKDDTAKALALSTIQEKDLAKVTAERDAFKARKDKRETHKANKQRREAAAAALDEAGRTERRLAREARGPTPDSSSDSRSQEPQRTASRIPPTPRIPATPRIPTTPAVAAPKTPGAAAPKTPAKRGRSMSKAPNRYFFSNWRVSRPSVRSRTKQTARSRGTPGSQGPSASCAAARWRHRSRTARERERRQRGLDIHDAGKHAGGSGTMSGCNDDPAVVIARGPDEQLGLVDIQLEPPPVRKEAQDDSRPGNCSTPGHELEPILLPEQGQQRIHVRSVVGPRTELEEAGGGSADRQQHGHGLRQKET